jgi:RNA polymerase-binding transcription factor DksA
MSAAEHGARIRAESERTRRQLADLVRNFDAIVEAARDSPLDDEHDPDGATVGFERAQAAALVAMARARLVELDDALERVRTGVYGRCSACGVEIDDDRLVALPTATTCVACAPTRRTR